MNGTDSYCNTSSRRRNDEDELVTLWAFYSFSVKRSSIVTDAKRRGGLCEPKEGIGHEFGPINFTLVFRNMVWPILLDSRYLERLKMASKTGDLCDSEVEASIL
jgi:hypothetical protein